MIRERVSNEVSKYRFADDDFVITPANSIADLINESAKLNHCVRTYDKRYASGETSIFLIRKRDDVNSPFYTLELSSKNEIKQLRGKNNCTAVNEVLDFVEGWRRKLQELLSTKIIIILVDSNIKKRKVERNEKH